MIDRRVPAEHLVQAGELEGGFSITSCGPRGAGFRLTPHSQNNSPIERAIFRTLRRARGHRSPLEQPQFDQRRAIGCRRPLLRSSLPSLTPRRSLIGAAASRLDVGWVWRRSRCDPADHLCCRCDRPRASRRARWPRQRRPHLCAVCVDVVDIHLDAAPGQRSRAGYLTGEDQSAAVPARRAGPATEAAA
jgi:hypothetical protein